jgi:hypothetical protein
VHNGCSEDPGQAMEAVTSGPDQRARLHGAMSLQAAVEYPLRQTVYYHL